MSKDGFIIYKSFYRPVSKLSDEQLGRLFRAIYLYQIDGDDMVDDDIEMAFEFFRNQFDIDDGKYQVIVERNRNNGRKGGRKQNPNNPVGFCEPKKADKEKDKENEKEKENDKENEKENVKGSNTAREAEKFAPLNANDVAFADFYRKAFKTDFVWQENTSEAIQRLADCITDKGGDMETMPNNITRFLEACYQLNDQWLNQRFTPSLLAKQFNQLYQRIITNGSKQTANYRQGRADNPTGVSAEFLAKIAANLGGSL